jgi:hypothetical protein
MPLHCCGAAASSVPEPPSLLSAIRAARPELTTVPTDDEPADHLRAAGLALLAANRPVLPTQARYASAPSATVDAPPDLTTAILAARKENIR